MNIPNRLTISRFALTALFLGIISTNLPGVETIALGIFIAASLTDYFDGKIARRDGLITNFGILMDPLADKILTCSAFIVFVGLDLIAAWMVVVIVARELAITGLRLLAASKRVVLAAEKYGKHKTISQLTALIAIQVQISYPDWGLVGTIFAWQIFEATWVYWFTEFAKWCAVALTLYSGIVYLWRNRELYLDDL